MITASGQHIQKIGGVAGTPTTRDIAVHAGRICRFGGAIWEPNLTHFVFVGLLAFKRGADYPTTLWAFLHDAHEVVTGEIVQPFKCDCMRTEQRAIDDRLMPMFHLTREMIDFDMVKRCDDDACDIEAVELGLPEYAAIETEYAADYKGAKEIYDDASDIRLFRELLRSIFYMATLDGMESPGVRLFDEMLTFAVAGERAKVWGLLNQWSGDIRRDPKYA